MTAPEDHLAIQVLYNNYNFRFDMAGDAVGVAELFVEDATWEHPSWGSFRGRRDIAAFMQRVIDMQQAACQHWNNNLLVDVEGDHANATAYVMTIDTRGEHPFIRSASIYRDRLLRTAEGWRFVARRAGHPFFEFRASPPLAPAEAAKENLA